MVVHEAPTVPELGMERLQGFPLERGHASAAGSAGLGGEIAHGRDVNPVMPGIQEPGGAELPEIRSKTAETPMRASGVRRGNAL
jgi:hypothetical protein